MDEVWFQPQAVRLLRVRIAGPSAVQYEVVLYTVICLLLAAVRDLFTFNQFGRLSTHQIQREEMHEMAGHTAGLERLSNFGMAMADSLSTLLQ